MCGLGSGGIAALHVVNSLSSSVFRIRCCFRALFYFKPSAVMHSQDIVSKSTAFIYFAYIKSYYSTSSSTNKNISIKQALLERVLSISCKKMLCSVEVEICT